MLYPSTSSSKCKSSSSRRAAHLYIYRSTTSNSYKLVLQYSCLSLHQQFRFRVSGLWSISHLLDPMRIMKIILICIIFIKLSLTSSTEDIQCGQRNPSGIPIFGGKPIDGDTTKSGEWPFTCLIYQLGDQQKFLGGASLLAPGILLTAAHNLQFLNNSSRQ